MAGKTHKPYHCWTEAEAALLVKRRDEDNIDWPEIARELGLSAQQCEQKYIRICDLRRAEERHAQQAGATGKASPEQVLDRDRREEARERRTQTQAFFGDPPPGFSALDRKMGRIA